MLPQLPPYPTHSPTNLISNEPISNRKPSFAPSTMILTLTPSALQEPITTVDSYQNETEGISLPPIHLPEKPPKLPPMPPIPSPVFPPSIVDITDHHEKPVDISKIAANQLIDRETFRKIVRPFEMASRMTVVFLSLSVALSVMVVSMIVFNAILRPFYIWYTSSGSNNSEKSINGSVYHRIDREQGIDSHSDSIVELSGHYLHHNSHEDQSSFIDNTKRSKNHFIIKNAKRLNYQVAGDHHKAEEKQASICSARGLGKSPMESKVSYSSFASHYDTLSANSSSFQNTASSEHHRKGKDKRSKARYSPTRVCTPPELSLIDDISDPVPLPTQNTKRTVKDLVQFYESPVRHNHPSTSVHVTPPKPSNNPEIDFVEDGTTFMAKLLQEQTTNSLEQTAFNSTGLLRSSPAFMTKPLLLHEDGPRNLSGLEWQDAGETISDSEVSGSIFTSPTQSLVDDIDQLVLRNEEESDEYWRQMKFYRHLNVMMVAAFLSLFFALVAYICFTMSNMTLRGSYYREGIWVLTYSIMLGLFITLRIAIVMVDEQQEKQNKQAVFRKYIRQLQRRRGYHQHRHFHGDIEIGN